MRYRGYFVLIVLLILRVFLSKIFPPIASELPFLRVIFLLINDIRASLEELVRSCLPSPHSELLLGMVVGIDDFGKLPAFKEALKTCGVVHVVVVSGFNINLVSNMILKLLGSKFQAKNLILSCSITFLYALLSGFEPPVIRAWVMGSISSYSQFYGRRTAGLHLLLMSALLMLLFEPKYVTELSFQLSVLATLGLILYTDIIAGFTKNLPIPRLFKEDLCTTIAAQIPVVPLLSYYFGNISLLGFVINPLVLWTVPIATFIGMLLCFSGIILPFSAKFLAYIVFPFLDFFVTAVKWGSRAKQLNLGIHLELASLILFYGLLLAVTFYLNKKCVTR